MVSVADRQSLAKDPHIDTILQETTDHDAEDVALSVRLVVQRGGRGDRGRKLVGRLLVAHDHDAQLALRPAGCAAQKQPGGAKIACGEARLSPVNLIVSIRNPQSLTNSVRLACLNSF